MKTNSIFQPKSFLFASWDGGGSIAPAITVARKLREQGHHVRFMSDHANRFDAESAGLEFRPWQLAPSRHDRGRNSCPTRDWEASTPQEGLLRYFDTIFFGPALEYARDVIAELEREPADLVVTSELLSGVMVGCESRGQKFAVLAANLCLYPIEGMPAFGPGLPPPRTPEEEALHEQIRQGTRELFNHGLKGINRARTALGLMPLENAVDQIHAAEKILLATSAAFDFPVAKLPEKVCYVGPQLDEPSWVKPWESPWPANDSRPLVAVGFSTTYQAHEGVLQSVVDALAGLPATGLVTLGQISPESIRPAANTILVTSAPHNAVMQEAAVVVTHGGHGTVMRALRHGRPMLIIPHGRDQDENAVRVAERGAGLRLPASASTQEIQSALKQLLEDESFTKAALDLGKAIAAGSNDLAADSVLEALASSPAARVHTAQTILC